jgi:hypothetical protein
MKSSIKQRPVPQLPIFIWCWLWYCLLFLALLEWLFWDYSAQSLRLCLLNWSVYYSASSMNQWYFYRLSIQTILTWESLGWKIRYFAVCVDASLEVCLVWYLLQWQVQLLLLQQFTSCSQEVDLTLIYLSFLCPKR